MLDKKRHEVGESLKRISRSRIINLTMLAGTIIGVFGCSTFSQKKSVQSEDHRRVLVLSQQLKRQRSVLEELRERNLVLERKLATSRGESVPVETHSTDPVPIPFEPSAALERRPQESTPDLLALPMTSSEQEMYAKIAESYRRHDEKETEKNLGLFLKVYPDSAFADNAVYQMGLLAFENGHTERADDYMNRVLREFPKGNKVVSALFAKAMIEKRKQHFSRARTLLNEIQHSFPGSPEANRVMVELRILNMTTSKKRES